MSDKLAEICAAKRDEVARRKAAIPFADIEARAEAQNPPRGFLDALRTSAETGYALIAEIKKASPSKGLIREDFDPPAHASAYEAGGATCLSVLTDTPYFQGADDYLVAARAACTLPVLRKDFMVDHWQVTESRALGADAILIIVAALDDDTMVDIEAAALSYGMDVLVEVHDEAELERAQALKSPLIGINNRDLKTFTTDLGVTERLARHVVPGALLVSESGIDSHVDCNRLAESGVRAFLVGESLMRQTDVESATRMLLTGHG
ncbi:indole-3-glycerol phosphate synthase TrpC [Parasphingopyxis lamellibrachiae]|uniref:Indole-3-glycerol phosphate synthase n=1 Tax=Parasphingopyxis lamellibrachiae TaxID=680125 RepID=A0A3D9FC90_9SPHN|nr:indole-3-glycerol phosphate synthase TrpC [Parasphingopyxis lamellibrachiae]RED15395.1 indole-3-glycerol phosphate synthase [Parasphingopyxis lamellibrachiae]